MTDRNGMVDDYINDLSDELRPLAERLREIVLNADPDVVEDFKWNRPVYYKVGRMQVHLDKARSHVSLGFFKGTSIQDPEGLLEGTGKEHRHIKVRSEDDVNEAVFTDMIREALNKV